MKLWALLPIFVEVALALPPGEVYKRHLDRLERGVKKHHSHGKNLSQCSHSAPHHTPSGTPPYNIPYNTPTNTFSYTHKSRLGLSTTTTSSSTPPATTTPGGNGGGDSTSQSDIQAYLDGHNVIRAKHNAAPLTWSSTLASAAETWAKRCVFEHSGGSLGSYGENLVSFSRSRMNATLLLIARLLSLLEVAVSPSRTLSNCGRMKNVRYSQRSPSTMD